jgi:glycosyltransferase involved in cell wall biosynthesis
MLTNQQPSGNPDISVLVTCYCEEKSIHEFFERLKTTMDQLGRSYEVIIVNDGSTDGTWDCLKWLYAHHIEIRCIMDFFQNSGQQAALTACINKARGKAVLFMDSDLQLAPEEIPTLVAEYDKGFDVVSGYRADRKDPLSRVIPSRLANVIMRKASGSDFRDFGCTFKMYHAKLIHGIGFGPHHVFSNVEAIARAARRKEVPVTHSPRKYGKSGWTFRKLWKYNMDNFVSLSERPFQILGLSCLTLGTLFIVRILVAFHFDFSVLRDISHGLLLNTVFACFLVVVAILCGIGELTIRIFSSSRKLPLFIVREEIERSREAD